MEAARAAFPGCDWEEGGAELVEEMDTASEEEDGYPTASEEEEESDEDDDPYRFCSEHGRWSHLHS